MMGSVKEYHHLLQSQLQYANEQILEKNRQIVKKDELICQQDQEIYNKSQVLQLNYQELQKKVQEIQKKNQRIQKSNQEIQKRNLRIQQRDTEIQQRDQLIQQKHEELWQVHQEMKLQLQQRYQEFQQKDQLLQHTTRGLRHKDMQLLQLNEEIQQEDQQIQLKVQEMQDTWKEIQQQIQQNDQKIQQYDKKLQEKSQEITQKAQQMQALQVDKQTLQQQVDELQAPTWVIRICDIRVLDKKLGTGGWGSVCEAILHGCKVAVKSLDHNIISQYNLGLFSREMNMAARCRHPNLLQFIGATNEGVPLIVTELMYTSLRKILEQGQLCSNQIISISLGVAYGLNYLHKTTPDPIIHRDVSSANVLLNPLPNNQWHPKLSDFGSTNFMRASNTISAGNPAYAAPEALSSQGPYTPAMDVFSFGVLMFEMCSREFPAQQPNQSTLNHVKWKATEATLIAMIRHCLALKYTERPAMEGLIKGLSH